MTRSIRFPAGALCLSLCLILGAGPPVAGQERGPDPFVVEESFTLQPAFPNPFRERTRIPFILAGVLFEDGRRPVVSMRIFNLLHQVVATPLLPRSARGPGGPLEERTFPRPGSYEAVWDGRNLEGEPARPGPYFVQLEVNGRTQVRKLLLTSAPDPGYGHAPGAPRRAFRTGRAPTAGGSDALDASAYLGNGAPGSTTARDTGSVRSSHTRRSARSVRLPTPMRWVPP